MTASKTQAKKQDLFVFPRTYYSKETVARKAGRKLGEKAQGTDTGRGPVSFPLALCPERVIAKSADTGYWIFSSLVSVARHWVEW